MSNNIYVVVVSVFIATIIHNGTVLSAEELPPRLSAWNRAVPFPYRIGGQRAWPILIGRLSDSDSIWLTAKQGDKVLAEGEQLRFSGLEISVTKDGRLEINVEKKNSNGPSMRLTVEVRRSKKTIAKQTLEVRPAPPTRPISYLADLVDDLIRIYWDSKAGHFRLIDKGGFDQYFRRLQAHGVSRLIVWQSPFPFTVNSNQLRQADWSRYKRQAEAILECKELTRGMTGSKLPSWKWMRMTMRLRMMTNFGSMFSRSAMEHQIKLTASFRPFEPALTKYYEVPAFDQDGKWLWGFLPAAWPAVNYQSESLCFANFRQILKHMNRSREAELASIEFVDIQNAKSLSKNKNENFGLRIVASHFPPIAADSFVLVRDAQNKFSLQHYRTIAQQAEKLQVDLSGFKVTIKGDTARISNLRIPNGFRFLVISRDDDTGQMIAAPLGKPIVVRSAAGNRLGRVNVYRCLDQADPAAPLTRIAGITLDGGYRTTFQAVENSLARFGLNAPLDRLKKASVVVDLGADWSVEMLDFEQSQTRQIAIDQLKTLLSFPAFDEIFINTRSHTQLAATTADSLYVKGPLAPLESYRLRKKAYRHLGIDLAFAPISLATKRRIVTAASKAATIEQITDWQDDEWIGPCQSSDSSFVWRFERNRAVAAGLRLLFQDLEREFPRVRIRAVIPPSEKVIRATRKGLQQMPNPEGGVYGSGYYRHMWSSLNYIPSIGEGMAMVDLSGTNVEPVFLGIRFAPASGPLDLYLQNWLPDLANNRGSKFRGPRSFFYEAQETLRSADREKMRKRRERIICKLLSHRGEVNEVILYEAADWTYFLPLSDPDHCGHGYLDRCDLK